MFYNLHVLVVDDHPLQCLHVETVLREVGLYQVSQAGSADEAMDLLRQRRYDLVIMDLDMPEADGVQFMDHLTENGPLPWLAISSSCDEPIRKSVERMGLAKGLPVIGTFPKPFTREHALQLRQRIQQGAPPAPPPIGDDVLAQISAEALIQAMQQGAIHGRFQPKVDIASRRIVGAEVLARWQHPTLGLVPPGKFLPLIQHHRLHQCLLKRMMHDGLQAHLAWNARGHLVPIAVNLPVGLLQLPDLPDHLADMADEAGVARQHIVFELLEDEPMGALDLFHRGASRLRLKGFGLSQDDFGRGYSSMYNLVSTPFTEVKIDRAFVHNVWNDDARRAVLASAIDLGHELGMKVTAEGVENGADLLCLQRLGCDRAQGFLFSPAINTDAFLRLLESKATTI